MLKLGYLGPEGTFTHHAAEQWNFGQFQLVPFISITAAINGLSNGKVERAIVPMENFLGGEVVETVDL
ncbi:MAG: prephenate dehydratase domain-containing protein, partial [bacterium]|nr:prephenate dehydratase domain-containing protein [bacterium]